MEALIPEEYRRALNYGDLSMDVNQYIFALVTSSSQDVPEELSEALDDLTEALNNAEEAQNHVDELIKAKSAYFCARQAILKMDKHGFKRSAIVGGIERNLYRVIKQLEPEPPLR
jgi:hypothetical protein